MNKRQIALLLVAAVACIGCCALPLYALITGVISLSAVAAVFTPGFMEMLICLVPLILIAGFWLYRRHQRKGCCTTPNNNCSDSQCSIEHKP
jgi:hypothetical protein